MDLEKIYKELSRLDPIDDFEVFWDTLVQNIETVTKSKDPSSTIIHHYEETMPFYHVCSIGNSAPTLNSDFIITMNEDADDVIFQFLEEEKIFSFSHENDFQEFIAQLTDRLIRPQDLEHNKDHTIIKHIFQDMSEIDIVNDLDTFFDMIKEAIENTSTQHFKHTPRIEISIPKDSDHHVCTFKNTAANPHSETHINFYSTEKGEHIFEFSSSLQENPHRLDISNEDGFIQSITTISQHLSNSGQRTHTPRNGQKHN